MLVGAGNDGDMRVRALSPACALGKIVNNAVLMIAVFHSVLPCDFRLAKGYSSWVWQDRQMVLRSGLP